MAGGSNYEVRMLGTRRFATVLNLTEPRDWSLLALLIVGSVRAAGLFLIDYTFDDAYIVARVARNAAEGHGLVYNLGERLQATTSLPYTLLLAALWNVCGGHALLAARVLACASDALSAAALTYALSEERLAQRLRAGWANAVPALYYALLPINVLAVPGGLETGFFGASVLLACLSSGRRRDVLAIALAAVATTLRPDGAIALVIVVVNALRHRARLIPSLAAAGLLVPFWIAQLAYYGSVIPQTVVAKSLTSRTTLGQLHTVANTFLLDSPTHAITGGLALFGILLGLRNTQWQPLMAWGVSHGSLMSALGFWCAWYFPPVALCAAAGLGLALFFVLERTAQRLGQVFSNGVCAALTLSILLGFGSSFWRTALRFQQYGNRFAAQMRAIGEWLADRGPKGANVLSEPLGVLGFYAKLRMDDYPGLASSKVTDALGSLERAVARAPYDADAVTAILRAVQPTYLVLREYERERLTDARVLDDYVTVLSEPLPGIAEDYTTMYVLERRPARGFDEEH